MRNPGAIIGALLVVAASASLPAGAAAAGAVDPQDFAQIERGHYLTVAGDCAACHTVAGSGHDFAGGRPIETPFGRLIAPNITPDPETGIGAWTDDEFVNSLTEGTGRGGTRLYPAMPYTYLTKLSRDDALAIRAYLNTVAPVRNAVDPNQLPFPFNIRSTLAVWNEMFFKPGPFRPNDGKSAEWNRGAYLAEGPTHCGMCHTPKNFLGGDKSSQNLQGYALQGWFAPNITNDSRRGLGGWSVDDIAEYLKTGHNKTSAATGLMSEMVSLSTSHMTDADLRAIAVYLKDQPGQEQSDRPALDEAMMKSGASIYVDECSGCHTADGKGTPGLFPSVNGSPVVQQADATSLLHIVLRGARSTGTDQAPTAAAMPAFAWVLKDEDVAAVLTYVRNTWGNSAPPVSASDVAKARLDLVGRTD
jgi:mono/diheme cytochrome c family protein